MKARVQIIPVLDLMHGQVVRGVAGDRDSYRPITSQLCSSADAIDVAQAIHKAFGLTRIYVADLDAIVFRKPNQQITSELVALGFDVILDAGIQSPVDIEAAAVDATSDVVVALESIESLDVVSRAVDRIGPQRCVFSLDLKNGHPMTTIESFSQMAPVDIVARVVDRGVENVIVLDLAAVGMGTGIPTLALCETLKSQHPQTFITTGGGVNCRKDVDAASAVNVDQLLIASALHDGRITPEQFRDI